MKRFTAFFLSAIISILLTCESRAVTDKIVIKRVNSEDKKIALTFDDGPHYKYTEEILDILAEYKVKATFFVVGTNAASHPEIIAREIEEGHEIGNHTYGHVYLRGLETKELEEEILRAEGAVADACEEATKLLRPPGGMYDEKTAAEAEKLGYKIILWSVDTRDWSHPSVSDVIGEVVGHVRCGDIILMHDFIGGAPSPTPEALRTVIPQLLNEGYEFVTVSELIS